MPCVSWCVVLLFPWSSGAPLSGVSVRCCARRVPAVSPPLCAPLARSLASPCSFRGFVALYPFLYPSPWHALFPCLRFVARLCLFSCRPGLPLLNLRRERRVRKQACGGGGFVATRHSCATGLRVGLSPHLLPACFHPPLVATFSRRPFRARGVTCNIPASFLTTLTCPCPPALSGVRLCVTTARRNTCLSV